LKEGEKIKAQLERPERNDGVGGSKKTPPQQGWGTEAFQRNP